MAGNRHLLILCHQFMVLLKRKITIRAKIDLLAIDLNVTNASPLLEGWFGKCGKI